MVGVALGGPGGVCGCEVTCASCWPSYPAAAEVEFGDVSGSGYGAGRNVYSAGLCADSIDPVCDPCGQFTLPVDMVFSSIVTPGSPVSITLCGESYPVCRWQPALAVQTVYCCNEANSACGMAFAMCGTLAYIKKDDKCYILFFVRISATTSGCTASCIVSSFAQTIAYIKEVTPGNTSPQTLDFLCSVTTDNVGTPVADICTTYPSTVTYTPTY